MVRAFKEFWKRYVDFSGQSTRSEFWYATLWNFLILTGIHLLNWTILEVVPDPDKVSDGVAALVFICILFFLLGIIGYSTVIMLPSIALAVRRLKDAGVPWGLIFLVVIPIFGWLALLILFCLPTKVPLKSLPQEESKN